MTTPVPLSIAAPKPIQLRWWQAGKVAPIDCTGMTTAVVSTTLPYTPDIDPVDLAQGRFDMVPPTPEQAAELRAGKTYGVHLALRNALGEGQEDRRFEIVAV